ncbi:MAG: TRAP transporter small permease subunit [Aurantimonas endophytica]|uniref:TRAP transporter small permease subunit n=1 Tax=Aurantimonas endophytica TaxID=1522175 RepID=UPI0030012A73
MRFLLRASRVLALLTNGVGKLAAWCLFPLMLVIVGDVVMRRYFAIGSIRLQEFEWHLHTVLFMLCLGYAYLCDAHVRIELVREGLGERARLFIEATGIVFLLLPLCWVMVDYSADLVSRSYAAGERSPHPSGLPRRWLIKAVMPVGYALLSLSALSILARSVVILFGTPEQRQAARLLVAPNKFEDEAATQGARP